MSADWVLTAAHIIKRVNQGELVTGYQDTRLCVKSEQQRRAGEGGRVELGWAELSGEECVM